MNKQIKIHKSLNSITLLQQFEWYIMVEFETVTAKEVKFGKNNFIEVAKKKAVSDSESREFISISRGYYLPDGSKRWKSSITLPDEKEKRENIAKLLKEL